jgi:hypothetical protein
MDFGADNVTATEKVNKAFLALFPSGKTTDMARESGLSKSTVQRAKRMDYSPAVCTYMLAHKPSMVRLIDYATRAYAQRQSNANGRRKAPPEDVPNVVIVPMGKPTSRRPFSLGKPLHQVSAAA